MKIGMSSLTCGETPYELDPDFVYSSDEVYRSRRVSLSLAKREGIIYPLTRNLEIDEEYPCSTSARTQK